MQRYENPDICYLSAVDNSIWAFAAPALLILCINLVIMVSIFWVIWNLEYRSDGTSSKSLKRAKASFRSIVILFPVTGTCWLFGLLSIQPHLQLVYSYLFTLTNSLQGLFLFLFYCVFQTEVRKRLRIRFRHLMNGNFCWSMRTTSIIGSMRSSSLLSRGTNTSIMNVIFFSFITNLYYAVE